MKKSTQILLIKLAVLAQFVSLNATVNLSTALGKLNNSLGTPLTTGSAMLIVDTSGNGFTAQTGLSAGSLSVGSYLQGSDDLVLGWSNIITSGPTASTASPGNASFTLGTLNATAGDNVAVVWFSTVLSSATSLVGGESYGFFSATSDLSGGSTWVLPSDGGASNFYFKTTAWGGTVSTASAMANLTVSAVPEPSVVGATLGGVVFLFALIRKRFAKRSV